MNVILILAGPYTRCLSTQDTWVSVCHSQNIKIDTYHLDNEDGEKMAEKYNLKTFPALICEDKVIAVGHPSEEQARKIIDNLVQQHRAE